MGKINGLSFIDMEQPVSEEIIRNHKEVAESIAAWLRPGRAAETTPEEIESLRSFRI